MCIRDRHDTGRHRCAQPVGREGDRKPRASAQRAVDPQHRTVPLHHVFDDGQAQAGAAGVALTAAVHPVEALGQAGNVFGRNAWAGVLYLSLIHI